MSDALKDATPEQLEHWAGLLAVEAATWNPAIAEACASAAALLRAVARWERRPRSLYTTDADWDDDETVWLARIANEAAYSSHTTASAALASLLESPE